MCTITESKADINKHDAEGDIYLPFQSTKTTQSDCVRENTRIAIVGKGPFGIGLYEAYRNTEHDVVISTRSANEDMEQKAGSNRGILRKALRSDGSVATNIEVMPIEEAIQWADVLFLAIPVKAHEQFVSAYLLPSSVHSTSKGLIVVDVSNSNGCLQDSNAKLLEKSIRSHPELASIKIVKGFNTTSAATLGNYRSVRHLSYGTVANNDKVLLCGDDASSKSIVMGLIRNIGMQAVDLGQLSKAWELEQAPLSVFSKFLKAGIFVGFFVIFYTLYTAILLTAVDHPLRGGPLYTTGSLPVFIFNKGITNAAMTCLALVYLPGNLLHCLKIVAPNFAANRAWKGPFAGFMAIRKQIGLISFWLILQHITYAIAVLNTGYFYDTLYATDDTDPLAPRARLNYYGELFVFGGVWAAGFLFILAICSIPSVGNSLTWKEWQLVNTWLGNIVVLFGGFHTAIFSVARAACPSSKCKGEPLPLSSYPAGCPPSHAIVAAFAALCVLAFALRIVLLAIATCSRWIARRSAA